MLAMLLDMLTYQRPAGSGAERAFINRFIAPLPGAYCDIHGNWHIQIGPHCAAPIVWSSHTDTVHRTEGRQTIHHDPDTGMVRLSKRSRKRGASCLGADCAVGVWIMIGMIKRGVPGRYIFHYGEEVGGQGSRGLAESHASWLESFRCAIAFDRRCDGSIITHQRFWYRTASDAFATSLGALLAPAGLTMRADDTGVYTDTCEYATLVPECTNLSVGFTHEHTPDETLDTRHAMRLLNALCTVDLSVLAVERTPEAKWNGGSGYRLSREYITDDDLYVGEEACPYHDLAVDCQCRDLDHGRYRGPLPDDVLASGVDAPYETLPLWHGTSDDDDDDIDFDDDAGIWLDPAIAAVQRELRLRAKRSSTNLRRVH